MEFAEFIYPLTVECFSSEFWLRKPVHIPAASASVRNNISWEELNKLFTIRPHWKPENVKLILNSQAVDPVHYLDGQLASVKQVQNFLAMGASLVLDAVEQVLPPAATMADMLSERFTATAGANFYASFKGVQAFASHCDTHEVFALHCAGHKRWKIYSNRAEHPLETLKGDGAQAQIDAIKGEVIMDVTMAPGDLLYIPRGYFHDAIAIDEASLHLTFGVAPHSGKVLFQLLEEIAISYPEFRAYLPISNVENKSALADHLERLSTKISEILASPQMAAAIAIKQKTAIKSHTDVSLPVRPALRFNLRTGRHAYVSNDLQGATINTGSESIPIGEMADAAQYALMRQAFSEEEVAAKHPHHKSEDLSEFFALMRRLQLIERYDPELG